MRVLFGLILLIYCVESGYAKKSVIKVDYKSLNNKKILLTGIITDIQHNIRARSNFYTFTLKVPEHSKPVKLKVYTINWLKRVNFFNCKKGDRFKGNVLFEYEGTKEVLGHVAIHQKNKTLSCTTPDSDDLNNSKEQ